MNGINLRGFGVRSFVIGGLTAKWGIGESRVPSFWDTALFSRYDVRSLADGALTHVPNTSTLGIKAPDLTVTRASMASGTLQFDGTRGSASTSPFLFPEKFTVFWDIDWLGGNANAGIIHQESLYMYNLNGMSNIQMYIKSNQRFARIPNTKVAVNSDGRMYEKTGDNQAFGGTVGTMGGNSSLYVARNAAGSIYTQLGFRQLLIFNRVLTQAEVLTVLADMFPT